MIEIQSNLVLKPWSSSNSSFNLSQNCQFTNRTKFKTQIKKSFSISRMAQVVKTVALMMRVMQREVIVLTKNKKNLR